MSTLRKRINLNETGVMAFLSWAEAYRHARRAAIIHDNRYAVVSRRPFVDSTTNIWYVAALP